ncbi:MAG: protoporphyrinogen oxidase [Anaerolineae bacterium]
MSATTEYTDYTEKTSQNGSGHAAAPPLRVVVVGGGIAGLATAYYLQRGARASNLELKCTLVESDSRLGGKIVTDSEGGFVVEGGPDSFLTQKPWALQLCRELGLSDRLIGTNQTRPVTILWKGRFRPLPEGVFLIVPTRFMPFALSSLFSPLGKLRMALDMVIPARRETSDESVADFIRRRLGSEALERLADPLMGGVHTSDPERQSLLASFPRFVDVERKYGSLIRGMLAARRAAPPPTAKPLPAFMSLRGGVQELVTALGEHLDTVDVRLGLSVTDVEPQNGGGYRVTLDDGSAIDADAVVLAVPARVAAPMVQDFAPELAAHLAGIRYISTATVSLGYRRSDIQHPLDSSGFLIPTQEGHRISGCTWSSTKFANRAPDDRVLLRCFIGRPTDQATPLLPEAELVRIARDELRALMGITAEPILTRVYRWRDGHPQYDVGHLDRMAEMDRLVAAQPGLYLTGSSYRGVGLPDCVHNASLVAEALLKQYARAASIS